MDWQIEVLKWIQSFKNPVLDLIFEVVTMSAEEIFFIVAAAWILWCHNKLMGYRIGFAFLTSTALNSFLKNIFRFERPIGTEGIVSERVHTATGYSFPSGHTQGASAFWSGIMLWYRRRPATIVALTMMLLVALSRMYLGVHWLSDIAGGLVFGIVWVLGSNLLFDYSRKIGKRALAGLLFLPLLIGVLFWNVNHDDNNLIVGFAAALGFFAGYLVEEPYIRFRVKNRWYWQLVKMALGLAIVFGLKEGLKLILPFPADIADFIRYLLIWFWISAGAPWLFKLLKLNGPAE